MWTRDIKESEIEDAPVPRGSRYVRAGAAAAEGAVQSSCCGRCVARAGDASVVAQPSRARHLECGRVACDNGGARGVRLRHAVKNGGWSPCPRHRATTVAEGEAKRDIERELYGLVSRLTLLETNCDRQRWLR